jgi:hypothetical protein
MPYVDDADLDGEKPAVSPGEHPADDSADHLMQIVLRVPATPGGERPAGIHGLIRRQLEMTVAASSTPPCSPQAEHRPVNLPAPTPRSSARPLTP